VGKKIDHGLLGIKMDRRSLKEFPRMEKEMDYGLDWYENGKKLKEETYKDGELISQKCWDEDGNEKECD